MATRYYPLDTAAAVSPTISGWDHTNTVRKQGTTTPDSSALTTVLYAPDGGSQHDVNANAHHRQIVTDPIGPQTISGTIKAQFQAYQDTTAYNLYIACLAYVVSNDGSTVRGTLLSVTRDNIELSGAGLQNRAFSATLSSVVAQNNDRIVIEIGVGGTPFTANHNAYIRWGGDASSGDLPENDTETGTTYRPWLEFSQTIADPKYTIQDIPALVDTLYRTLKSYRQNLNSSSPSFDSWYAQISLPPLPPTKVLESSLLADRISYILSQYRRTADNGILRDVIITAIQRNLSSASIDATQFKDLIMSTIARYDTVLANQAKPISRPRWLFDANIGGMQRFSSEDMEKP